MGFLQKQQVPQNANSMKAKTKEGKRASMDVNNGRDINNGENTSARIYRPCFRENWVYKFGHRYKRNVNNRTPAIAESPITA
jgi:hypothetical protein